MVWFNLVLWHIKFKCQTVLFDPYIGPRVKVDLGAMAVKRYFPFPKAPALLNHRIRLTCITKVPFHDPSGNIYIQTDGISIELPLGPTISEFYMSHIENEIFTQPKIYVRYVEDIFIVTQSYDEINKLKLEKKTPY